MEKRDKATPNIRRSRSRQLLRLFVSLLVWSGAVVLYYIAFSIFFDTPIEYEMKHETDLLRTEYEELTARYDTLMLVLDNLSERDRGVFRSLFESDPYDFEAEYQAQRDATYEAITNRSTRALKRDLRDRIRTMEEQMQALNISYHKLNEEIQRRGNDCNHIPSIQPVINKQLTLLTTSYGMRINPFYKTIQAHQGVDYSIPEGSRVFATADGVVRDVSHRSSTSGNTIVIDHGNGYTTSYSHLSQIAVHKGQTVRRGDIIAHSGDTGLSLAPHLHYEVRLNDVRVDPIHYFFMELTPSEYQRMTRIARSGMQAFD